VSDVVPLVAGVMDSSIWFFILGIMIGFFSLVASVLVGAVEE
jgi:membrane protein YqaA with SNARE-associated domain